jgi:tryptophan synthase alpha subunit
VERAEPGVLRKRGLALSIFSPQPECVYAGGINGFIVVDLPPEEGSVLLEACKARGLSMIPLVAPTTSDERLAAIAPHASGYVYCVSVTGVTGARSELPEDLGDFVARVKRAIPLPAVVGFGLSTRSHVEAVGKVADGAVMGSAIVKAAGEGGAARVRELIESVVVKG